MLGKSFSLGRLFLLLFNLSLHLLCQVFVDSVLVRVAMLVQFSRGIPPCTIVTNERQAAVVRE